MMRPTVVTSLLLIAACSVPAFAADDKKTPCDASKSGGGEIAEAIVGFQQAGASAASSAQKFFFDFYVSRPVPIGRFPCGPGHEAFDFFGPRLRWWGNVRVASYPQQVSTSVATFAANFSAEIGKLPVNKLAQTAEFVSGLEWRVAEFGRSLRGNDRNEGQRFTLSVFGGGGASGPLQPSDTLQIFETPPGSSPQHERFAQTFPAAASSKYVGFISPDRDRFFRQYSGGLRMTTFYVKNGEFGKPDQPYLAAPAMVSFSLGRNEMITGGVLQGIVGRFEAFYPLLLWGDRSDRTAIIYLFGTAMLRLGAAHQSAPFALKPAGTDKSGSDPDVALVTSANNRDTYVIGVGIDLTQVLKKPAAMRR